MSVLRTDEACPSDRFAEFTLGTCLATFAKAIQTVVLPYGPLASQRRNIVSPRREPWVPWPAP